MADNSQNDKNQDKDKRYNKDEEKRGSQGGRSSYDQGESKKDSWSMDDETMDENP